MNKITSEKRSSISETVADYGANIDAAIIKSLYTDYEFKLNVPKTEGHPCIEIQANNDQYNLKEKYNCFKDDNSDSADSDIIGMMWEPELDFVDDPECFDERKNKIGPMRFMCGVCLGQFRTRCALDIHFRMHKGEKSFKCVLCDDIYNELATLKHHRESHNMNELVTCGNCGLVYTELYHMIKHKKKCCLKKIHNT